MAVSRVTVWNAGDTLTAAALNGEINNLIDNALSMISPLTGNLNANLKQITNLLLETQASSQTAATEGRVYYQTTEDQVHVDDGTNIRRVPTIASVTRGDMIRAGATANQWERLARGTAGTLPISDGTDIVTSTIRLPNSALTNGQLIVGSTGAAASAAALTAGTNISVTNGAGTITVATTGEFTASTVAPATPVAKTLYEDSIPKVWCSTTGGTTQALDDDVNVSSITDGATGLGTVVFATVMANATYGCWVTCLEALTTNVTSGSRNTTDVGYSFRDYAGALADPGTGGSVLVLGNN